MNEWLVAGIVVVATILVAGGGGLIGRALGGKPKNDTKA